MSISNYTELQTAVIDWSHRTDLASKLPDFIRLAEDVIYGDLNIGSQETVTSLVTVANQETVALPTGFIHAKSLSITSSEPLISLEYLVPSEFQSRAMFNITGRPIMYTIIGSNIYLNAIPDDVYTLRLIYEAKIPYLSVSAPTNDLLTNYPSIYLYASLVQMAIYTKKDYSALQLAYEKAINGVNIKDWALAAPMRVRNDVNLTTVRP